MFKKRSSLLAVLSCLTLLSLVAQISLFLIHSQVSALIDDLIDSSIANNLLHGVVLWPIAEFILIQILAYLFFVSLLWFMTVCCAAFFRISTYWLGIFFWLVGTLAIFTLNRFYFPDSFFARLIENGRVNDILLSLSLLILGLALCLAYYQAFRFKQQRAIGAVFLSLSGFIFILGVYNHFSALSVYHASRSEMKPNIIMIGLDSLRPDFIGYLGKAEVKTPTIDYFIKTAVHFSEAYTPLARTFPAWVSILTAKNPKNSHARINLNNAKAILANETLAKRLQEAGYQTIYATDEKRFSNITPAFGFDQVIGPQMGLGDFILGGLSDFPLTNLLINLPLGRFIFPFNYGNRAAAITYEPDKFLQLVKMGLHQRQEKPLFLALHFCLTHWPFTWAQDQQRAHFLMNQRYQSSVEQVDQQLAKTLQILKESGLLERSIVILLSDHGTTFGLPGDRLVEKKNYQGDPTKLAWMTVNKLYTAADSDLNLKQTYVLNTAYGQGTDVLSLKQYQVLLAIKYFGLPSRAHRVAVRSSLLDLAPTILAALELAPMEKIDGRSLLPEINSVNTTASLRPFYLETGHSVSEIETNKVDVEGAIKHSIKLYQLDPENGYLSVRPAAERSVLKTKQRAILLGPWILARYPASIRKRLVPSMTQKNALVYKSYRLHAYYVLANIETGKWTIGFDTALARNAPLAILQKQFKAFYGDEL